MRTLRYESNATTSSGSSWATPVIDLFDGNLSVRRRDMAERLGRVAFIDAVSDDLDAMYALSYAIIENWATATQETLDRLENYALRGVKIYLHQNGTGATIDTAIATAVELGLEGIYQDATPDVARIRSNRLKAGGTSSASVGPLSLVAVKWANATNLYNESSLSSEITKINKLLYKDTVRFYVNEDENHWPGIEGTAATGNISIPAGTVVATDDGARFITLETVTLTSGTKSVLASIRPLDTFLRIEKGEIQLTSLENVYVYNDAAIEAGASFFYYGTPDYTKCIDYYAGSLACNCTLRLVNGEDPWASDPKIYIGDEIISLTTTADSHVFTTDIGTVTIKGGRITVRNELVSVMEHLVSGSASLKVRTADTTDQLDTDEYVPYSNSLPMHRYVQFLEGTEDAPVSIVVTLSDDDDRIHYLRTDRMVDQLPQWMSWREESSTGYELVNILARYLEEIFDGNGFTMNFMLQDLDKNMNGHALVTDVDPSWIPQPGDVSDAVGDLPMASDADELLLAGFPCYYLQGGYIYIVGTETATISTDAAAGTLVVENLWTPFDDWGLQFNLSRFEGESLYSFRLRVLDIYDSGFGSTKDGLKASLIRELSPLGLDDESNDLVEILDLEDASLKSGGFPTDTMVEAVRKQRSAGVHTWDNAVAGKAIFNADGDSRLGQGRIPYAYDTDLSDKTLTSGTGPSDDLKIVTRKNVPVDTTVTIKKEGYTPSYTDTGKRLRARIGFFATGNHKTLDTSAKDYSVDVTLTTAGTTYTRTLSGVQASSVNPNAAVGTRAYTNTNSDEFLLMDTDYNFVGVWHDNTANRDVDPPTISAVTNVTVNYHTGYTNADCRFSLFYSDDDHDYLSSGWKTASYSTAASTATILQSSHNGLSLIVQTTPFDASGAQAAAWTSAQINKDIYLYDTVSSGSLTGSSIVVAEPSIDIPSYVTGVAHKAIVVETVPTDNGDIGTSAGQISPDSGTSGMLHELADRTLINATTRDAAPTGVTITNNTCTVSFNSTGIVADGTGHTCWPYPVLLKTPWSATSTVSVTGLANPEDRRIVLNDSALPTVPVGAVVEKTTCTSNKPGILVSLSGNTLSVSRNEDINNTALYANTGYYWLAGTEDYLYTNETPTSQVFATPGATALTLTNQPKDMSLVKVVVDGSNYTYQFYQGADGTKVFDDLTDSFYVDGKVVHLSDAVTTTATVTYEPASAAGTVATGITITPTGTWDSRYFIAYDSVTPTVNSVTVTADRDRMVSGLVCAGCDDMVVITAQALDIEGNPVTGASVTWPTAGSINGVIARAQLTTGEDGRAVAYYFSRNSNGTYATGSQTISVTIGGKSGSVKISFSPLSVDTEAVSVTASYPSMVPVGSDFTAQISSSTSASSIPYDIDRIAVGASKNIEGTWANYEADNLRLTAGSCSFTRPMSTAGLYRMRVGTMTLVWRVY